VIKLKEKWLDDDGKIYYYMEYYNSDNELDYSWWHVDDYVIDEIIINNLNRKRKEAAYNMKLDWSKKLPDNGDMD
jgi:hypothetical protein